MPAFFAGEFFELKVLQNSFLAFLTFSLVASGVYVFNDIFDKHSDRLHPTKKHRPLASGQISITFALFLGVGLILTGLFASLSALGLGVFALLLFYLINNIFYNFFFRKIAIVDICSIALGFVIRVFVGSWATGILLSSWIIIMTFLLALFLGLSKRRNDLLVSQHTGQKIRKSIDDYSLHFVDTAMNMMSGVILVSYLMYTISPDVEHRIGNEYFYLTTFWVILGILRYLNLTLVLQKAPSPTDVLLKDGFMQIILLGWVLTFWIILYTGV